MSQPLSGQVVRLIKSRKHSLSPTQRQMLFTLADRIPRGRLDWETTWKTLADDMSVHPVWLRTRAYELRKMNLISLERTRYGVRITLLPPFISTAPECKVSYQSGEIQSVRIPCSQSVRKTAVDRPLTIPEPRPEERKVSGRAKRSVCERTPNQSNGAGAHTPPLAGPKAVISDLLTTPAFEPLDTRMVARLRVKYAEKVIPLLESRLRALREHLTAHPADRQVGDVAWWAIKGRIKAINAWISGL